MNKTNLHLSNSYRLEPELIKNRVASLFQKKPFSYISELKQIRSGNKLSRLFRRIFEHKHFKKILGSNIALAIVATAIIPTSASAAGSLTIPANQPEIVIRAPEAPLTTQVEGTRLPVKELRVTQRFSFFHSGVDLDGVTGDPINPIKDGIVEKVIYSKISYGNHIYINHGDGVVSLYAHLSKIFVKEGDIVTSNQIIGLMGSTGHSTGDHLHLEVHINGKATDPLRIIQ